MKENENTKPIQPDGLPIPKAKEEPVVSLEVDINFATAALNVINESNDQPDVLYFLEDPEKRQQQKRMIEEMYGDVSINFASLQEGSYSAQGTYDEVSYPVGTLAESPEDDTREMKKRYSFQLSIDPEKFSPDTDISRLFEDLQNQYHLFLLKQEGINVDNNPEFAMQIQGPMTLDSVLLAFSNANFLRLSGYVDRYKEAFSDPELPKLIEEDFKNPIKVTWNSFESAQDQLAQAQKQLQQLKQGKNQEAIAAQAERVSQIQATIGVALYKIGWSQKTMRYKSDGVKIDTDNSQRTASCVGVSRGNNVVGKKLFGLDISEAIRNAHAFEQIQLENGKTLLLDHGKKQIVDLNNTKEKEAWMREQEHTVLYTQTDSPSFTYMGSLCHWDSGWQLEKGDAEGALLVAEMGVNRNPKNPVMHSVYSWYLEYYALNVASDPSEKKRFLERALLHYKKSNELSFMDVHGFIMEADILHELGYIDEQKTLIKEALELNRNGVNMASHDIACAKHVFHKMDDKEWAIQIMENALEIRKDSFLTPYEYAMMLPDLHPGESVFKRQKELLDFAISICDHKGFKKKCKDAREKLVQKNRKEGIRGPITRAGGRRNISFTQEIQRETDDEILKGASDLFDSFLNAKQDNDVEYRKAVTTRRGFDTDDPGSSKRRRKSDFDNTIHAIEDAQDQLNARLGVNPKKIQELEEMKTALRAIQESGNV